MYLHPPRVMFLTTAFRILFNIYTDESLSTYNRIALNVPKSLREEYSPFNILKTFQPQNQAFQVDTMYCFYTLQNTFITLV